MMKNILAALFVFIAASCFGLDINTRDGKSFSDCTVKAVERDGVRIMHRDGTAFLDFDVLPSALQKQYGWTADKSAARKAAKAILLEKEQQVAAVAFQAQQAAKVAAEENRRQAQVAAKSAKAAEAEKRVKEASATADKDAADVREGRAIRNREENFTNMWMIVGILSGIFAYFIPTFIARGQSNMAGVFFLNLFGGFTGILWIVALVWAVHHRCAKPTTIIQTVIVHTPPQPRPDSRPVAVPRVVAKAILPPRNPQIPPGA